jgi:hypothetical protein
MVFFLPGHSAEKALMLTNCPGCFQGRNPEKLRNVGVLIFDETT